MEDIGWQWQRLTSHLIPKQLKPTARLSPSKRLFLPEPANLNLSLQQTLSQRRTKRHFSSKPVDRQTVATLCWAAYGVNETRGRLNLHTAPSAGATYPLELYLVARNNTDLAPGIYQYQSNSHSLTVIATGDFSQQIAWALLDQDFVAKAALTFIWTGVVERCARRYRQRAYRYIYLEAGHQNQNLLLAATALGLASCPVGAFFDEEVASLLGIDGVTEIPVYTVVVGWLA